MSMDATAIGLMCKPPRVGVSKTRLAAETGAEMAARLSAAFLKDVAATAKAAAQHSGAAAYALFTPDDAEAELRGLLPPGFRFMAQRGADLGQIMHHAIADLVAAGHRGALVVGADLPTLPQSILTEAVETIRDRPEAVVIGPARDGGYYLIGMQAPQPLLFREIAWSTPHVLAATLARAAEVGLPVHLLPAWYDVDDAASLAFLRAELAHPSGGAPEAGPAVETRRVLASLSQSGALG